MQPRCIPFFALHCSSYHERIFKVACSHFESIGRLSSFVSFVQTRFECSAACSVYLVLIVRHASCGIRNEIIKTVYVHVYSMLIGIQRNILWEDFYRSEQGTSAIAQLKPTAIQCRSFLGKSQNDYRFLFLFSV